MVEITRKRAAKRLHSDEFSPLDTTQEHLLNEVCHGRLRAVQFGKDSASFKRSHVREWLDDRQQAHH